MQKLFYSLIGEGVERVEIYMRIIRALKLVVILLCSCKPVHRLACKLAHELIAALQLAPCFCMVSVCISASSRTWR